MANRKKNRPVVEYPTRLRPVRVYKPTTSCPYFSATWYEPGIARQQRTTLGKDKPEALRWAADKAASLTQRQQSPRPDRPLALVGELVDEFVKPTNHARWGQRKATKMADLCRTHLDEQFRSVVCEQLMVDDLQRILDIAATKYADSTLASVRTVLSGIVRFGHSRHYLLNTQNPMLGLETPRGQMPARPTAVSFAGLPGAAAVDQLVESVSDLTYATMIRLAAANGMRFGELAGLPWFNVHLETRKVLVDRTLVEDTNGKQWIDAPKSRSARWAFFPEEMLDELTALVAIAKERAEHDGLNVVFPSPEEAWLRRSNFSRRYWKPAHVDAGWNKEWTFQTLRHVAARNLIDELKEFDAADILGHADTNFTRRVYADAFEGAADRAVKMSTVKHLLADDEDDDDLDEAA